MRCRNATAQDGSHAYSDVFYQYLKEGRCVAETQRSSIFKIKAMTEANTNTEQPESILHAPVSVFRNYKSTEPEEKTRMVTFLTKKLYEEEIARLRSLTDKKKRDRLKAALPACTPSGVFSKRENASLIQHSGLMQFDIDFKDNTHIRNYNQLKQQLSNIRNVAYCGLSVSGTGFWGLVPIKHPDLHTEHFNSLYKAFKSMGINIDQSCKDVSRLRGYSYDDEAYFNFKADVFCSWEINQVSSHNNISAEGTDLLKVEQAVLYLEENKLVLCNSYGIWIEVACSLASNLGETGRSFFQRISILYPKNDLVETNKVYDGCLKKAYRYTLGTFFFHLKTLKENRK